MLSDIIRDHIAAKGPLPFSTFMDMALYYPELGYYASGREKIGLRGDFVTSPSLHPLFGQLLARQLLQMWDLTGEEKFTVIEYGAGPGFLCRDILKYIEIQYPHRYSKLEYCIIEKSDPMRQLARNHVPAHVIWLESIEARKDFTGCVLSNELLDNFPVHRVIMQKELLEIQVDYQHGFREILVPASDALKNYFEELRIKLQPGFSTEVNLQAGDWISEIAKAMRKGFVLTIDYGYPAAELAYEHQRQGTLTCFNHHRVSHNPYERVGEQDITAHVNFSGLALAGHRAGLDYTGFTDQAHFLSALGFYELIKESQHPGNDYYNYKLERHLSNILLGDMGYKFKVLVQQKGLDKCELTGLRSR